MKPKAVIFDCFGVLCDEIANRWFGTRFPSEEGERLKKVYCRQVDLGTLSDDEFFAALSALTPEGENVQQTWVETLTPHEDVLALVRELKGRYQLAICSNAGTGYFHTIANRFGLIDMFDEIIVSSEEGVAKPDPAIFALVLERLGVTAEDALFIDDNPANLAGAASLGIPTLLCTGPDALVQELRARL